MLSIELNDIIKRILDTKAASQTIEVKAAHGGTPKRLYDTLSSFSNQDGGGIIIFGLDEAQEFKPVSVYDLQILINLKVKFKNIIQNKRLLYSLKRSLLFCYSNNQSITLITLIPS